MDIIISFWMIEFGVGLFVGLGSFCFDDYTWDWIKRGYLKRNRFGAITFSLLLLLILPAVLASLFIQGLINSIIWIYKRGLK